MRGLTVCLLLAGLLLSPAGVDAGDGKPPEGPQPEIAGLRVGFSGSYRVGVWTPVEVTLRGGSEPIAGELSLTVPDGDGVPSRVTTPPDEPCRLLPGHDTRVLLYARFGRITSTLTAEFRRADGQLVARKEFTAGEDADQAGFRPAVAAGRELIVEVGAEKLGVEGAIGLQRQPPGQQTVVARLGDVTEMPQRWIGYEGVDTLVISTSRPEIFRGLSPSGPCVEALDEWVRMGGKLVICVGSQAEEFRGGEAPLAPLARFLPGRLETEKADGKETVKIFPLRQTGALETYCGSSLPIPSENAAEVLQVPKLAGLGADCIVEAQEADLPLVVRAPRGFGQIVLFAGDLDRPPLSRWGDRPRLVSKLLGLPAVENEESVEHGAIMHYGFDDLAGQLRSALDQFSGVKPVSFRVVVALLVVYLLLIGPGDYFFLRKVVGRMEWTWLSFTLIVLVFTVGAYLAAHHFKGGQVRINQVDLVDVDVKSGWVRGTSWMDLFSPQAKSFNLSLQPELPDGTVPRQAGVWLAWLGLPGGALGGMDRPAFDPEPWTEGYAFSPELDAMRGVPLPIWSTKSLTARWAARTKGYLKAELVEEGQVPVGTITNTLQVPLSKCLLIFGRHAYTVTTRDNLENPGRLGTLRPGESTHIDARTWRTELKTLLTGRRLVNERQVSTPYDQSSVELPYILQAMMFFKAAGGRGYSGLGNAYQGFVDLTDLLTTNRAVLVAQGPGGPGQPGQGADLLCKDRDDEPVRVAEDKHLTVYRFVFPVKTGAAP
jgi:hypothetical protein